MTKFKFDNNILLHLLLKENKITKQDFQKRCYQKLNLKSSSFIKRETIQIDEIKHQHKNYHETPTHLILATDYGRILSVEEKPKNKPTITIKKKRIIENG